MTKETSWKIKNMGFICALLVVSIHIDWHEDESQLLWWGRQLIKGGIAGIAVPFFFVVSGYFLAAHFDEDGWWKREVGKRIKSLVVPFYLWTIIYILATIPLSVIADQIAHRPFGTSILLGNSWLRRFGLDLCDYPTLVPLWYVRCLFLFVLTGASFKWGVTKAKWWWLSAVFIVFAILSGVFDATAENERPLAVLFLSRGYSLSGVFYFSVGVFLQRFGFRRLSDKMAYAFLGIGLVLLGVKVGFLHAGYGKISVWFNSFITPFLLYSIYHFMPTKAWPNWLTSCAFPIFLMHSIALSYFGIALKHIPIVCVEAQTLIQFAGGAAIPIAVAVILRRFFPKTAGVLFGGR